MPDSTETQREQSPGQLISNEQLLDSLNRLLSREYHSLIHYIHDANPYIPADRDAISRLLEQIVADERRHAELLGKLIIALHGIPQPAPYDLSVADINYLSLDYLAAMMLKEKQDLLHEYQHLIAQLDHLPGVRLSLKRIAAEEDIHLKVLKDLFSRARSAQS